VNFISEKQFCVCILAHNEQKHIARTIKAIRSSCTGINFQIKVYANGCTDRTVEIVRNLSQRIPNVFLRELGEASKPNAWNAAFAENKSQVLVFADGDVQPEFGAIPALWRAMTNANNPPVLVGCTLWPQKKDLSLGQGIVGFMQTPLRQDFLCGGLYAVNREALRDIFKNRGLRGIPEGVVAEDSFLELIVPPEKFLVIQDRVLYEPPEFRDYCKYLARIRWQEDQLLKEYGWLFSGRTALKKRWSTRLKEKFSAKQGLSRWVLGLSATCMRFTVKVIYKRKINRMYQELGSLSASGKNILSQATRSNSAK
jgi:glycosyltransferase involved in cell wall biosynthesis